MAETRASRGLQITAFRAALLASCFIVFFPLLAFGQSREERRTVHVIYEAISASNTIVYLAGDQGIYDKYGLDARIIHGRGQSPIQALLSGSVEIGALGVPLIISANLKGSDLVLVAGKPNFIVMSVWTRKDSPIRALSDLKGKTIGVTAPYSSMHMIARVALRRAGLEDKDVRFLHHGSLPELFASLSQGLVDACLGSTPRPGFRELVDLAKERIPFAQGALVLQRGFIQSQRQVTLSFLRAYLEATRLAKQRPELAIKSLTKHLRVKEDVARSAYDSWMGVLEDVPYVRLDSLQALLDLYPRESRKEISGERFIDNSLLKELESSGFVKNLYGR